MHTAQRKIYYERGRCLIFTSYARSLWALASYLSWYWQPACILK